ncbi:MAG: DEAD/DEAH box helicase [Fimbriimonadaceae bacterium]
MKSGFLALGVSDDVCSRLRVKNIIRHAHQAGAIPLGMQGKDGGLAQTGTGKTLAFGLPITERLATGQVALILAPTRELAHQIAETLDLLGLKRVLVVGGESMHMQVKHLRKPHEVVIATPRRLMDHMCNSGRTS